MEVRAAAAARKQGQHAMMTPAAPTAVEAVVAGAAAGVAAAAAEVAGQ